MYSIDEIAEITGSVVIGKKDRRIAHYLNDSRALQSPEDTLFIALKSQRNNGHKYIPALVKAGVRSFLILKDEIDPQLFPDVSFIVSRDPLLDIQKLARYHRSKFNIPVIGITGSNGKTIVKEWLYQLLKENYTICRSPKSYNSQIGVPLSVLNLNPEHTLAIFEAGISLPGEMEKLATIIKPTIGVFTHMGSAHDEGFESRSQKIEEKFKLFSSCEKIIVNGIDEAEIPASFLSKSIIVDKDLLAPFNSPFSDLASVGNANTCGVVMRALGYHDPEIAAKIRVLQPVALRLELKNGINNSLLINDYYNSDLDSLKIALNHLQRQNRRSRKVIIVSDIEQSGISSGQLYLKLAELFKSNNVDQLIGIGEEISQHHALFPEGSLFFDDTFKFVENFKSLSHQLANSTILLKGARSFGFESISRLLQQKSHDTVFEVNLNRLVENVNYYRGLLQPKVQLMCMVKAMGYGSGSAEIARTLEDIGVNYLAVAYADEGVELREAMSSLPIMVMNPEEDGFEDIINYKLEPEIYNFKVLDAFTKTLDKFGITDSYPVHVKIDTGMHRLGFEEEDLSVLVEKLKSLPNISVRSVFSHLAAADDKSLDDFTNEQLRIFKKACQLLEEGLGYTVTKHICNSAGISRFKEAHFDMVRLGIGMYGVGTSKEEQKKLQNVGTLKSRISQIKNVKPGDTVGYSRRGKVEKEMQIATIPIGYADGFSRQLGNAKHGVYIHNKLCKTVGNICMDMCMIDITGLKCNEGDEVIIFENIEQINAMAAALNSISYEVLTNVSGRVKRIYVQE